MEEPTPKQLEYIKKICSVLNCEFTGTTKDEARFWIGIYASKYKAFCRIEKEIGGK